MAKFEHRAILESLSDIEALAPGLYEMKIENPTGDPECHKPDYVVKFEPRDVSDIGEKRSGETAFERAKQVSEMNEAAYSTFVSPWLGAMVTPYSAEILKRMHPMRVSRMMFSERFNPWMKLVHHWADAIGETRVPLGADDPRIVVERAAFDGIGKQIQSTRILRDQAKARAFETFFGRPDEPEQPDTNRADNDTSPRMGV